MKSPSRLLFFLLIFVGLACMVFGTGYYLKNKVPSSYKSTNGTVAQITSQQGTYCVATYRNYCGRKAVAYKYYAVVNFSVNSKDYSFTENLGDTGENNYHTGQTVSVAYNPASPSNSPKDTDNNMTKGIGQIFAVIGLLFFLVGAVPIVLKRSKKNKR